MRLWHKSLIEVLPREQLVSQWRECSAIAGNIIKKGTPNHILVNKIMDYPLEHFISYSFYVKKEMLRRNYNIMDKVWNKICSVKLDQSDFCILEKEKIFLYWHDLRYLVQCFYNLQEKYDCGGIRKEDWQNITKKYFVE